MIDVIKKYAKTATGVVAGVLGVAVGYIASSNKILEELAAFFGA